MLRLVFLGTASLWVVAAVGLATEAKIPAAVAGVVGVVGVIFALLQIRSSERRRRALLSRFVDPLTGEIVIPGERRAIPRRFVLGFIGLAIGAVLTVALLVSTHA
jgi:hypothetical protein